MTNKSLNKKSLVLLVFFATILYFIQPFFSWFVADDFCYMPQVQKEGVFSRMWHDYMTWDGRCISLTYPFSRLGLYFGIYWFGPLLGSILLISTLSMVLYRLQKFNIVNAIVLTALFWLASFNFLSQTLYWSTAVGYILDLSMLYWAFHLFSQWKGTRLQLLIAIPVFFYAGTASPGGVLALLVVLFLQVLNDIVNNQKKDVLKCLLAFGLILIGFLFVVLSPGNANRLVGMDLANLTHIWTIYFNAKLTFSKLWDFNTPVIWGLFGLGLLGSFKLFANFKNANRLKSMILFMFFQKWLIAAIITVVFFIPFPGMHSPRTNIHFVFFMLLYGLDGLIVLYKSDFINSTISKSFKTLTLSLFIIIAASQLFDANYSMNRVAERHDKLSVNKGLPVILTKEDIIKTPTTRRFEDVSTDSSYWLNKCVQHFYGLEYIKFEDAKSK